jgi:hypothetical protein
MPDDLAYQRTPAWREMADGTFRQAEALTHPEPIGEALRWQACEAELVQLIARGRASAGRRRIRSRAAAVPPLCGNANAFDPTERTDPHPVDRVVRDYAAVIGLGRRGDRLPGEGEERACVRLIGTPHCRRPAMQPRASICSSVSPVVDWASGAGRVGVRLVMAASVVSLR